MKSKKIIFVSGTRADFGKIKSLIKITQSKQEFTVKLFVTGMHLYKKYGYTINEIKISGISNIFQHKKSNSYNKLDKNFISCYHKFNEFLKKEKPKLVVVHGDRVEALACGLATVLNNIKLGHIEGGEVSGSIDESIRHSISKLAHYHFVSNLRCKKRLSNMGEEKERIYVIGSPETDYLVKKNNLNISKIKRIYNISFSNYAIFIYHSSFNEMKDLKKNIKVVIDALIESSKNYIIIYPNNDEGSDIILKSINNLKKNKNFLVFPSIRFEYFINLLRNSSFMIGNSSSGVREAPALGINSVNIGTRQYQRSDAQNIINCDHTKQNILKSIQEASSRKKNKISKNFGRGKSDQLFLRTLKSKTFWSTNTQKKFIDVK